MKKIISISILSILLFFSRGTTTKAIAGIDISEWQRSVDFTKVKEEGIEIVYIRSSAGNSYVDAKFEENYRNAKNAGLKIGFYHYVTARNTTEAKEQARFFASVIAGKEADCKIAMDFETFRGLNREEINEIARTFLETLQELTNKELIIYSDAYNRGRVFDKSLFDKYPLWVAEYGVERPEVEDWVGWQYSDRGKINGIEGNVDKDEFKESIYLSDKSTIKAPEIKEEEKTKIVYYRVVSGDTLSKIASRYHVTVNDLVKWNKIKRPNLIFPDEILKIKTYYDYQVTSKGTNTIYKVKKWDTLTKIARMYGITISNLVTWNNIKNPNLIYPNEPLIIKPQNNNHTIRYIVKPGDTLSLIADKYHVSLYELIKINKIKNPNIIRVGEGIYIPETYILEDK